MSMDVIDGGTFTRDYADAADVVVVGSGPAGAAVARTAARAGASVIVLEEGAHVEPRDFPEDGFTAMARLYRDMGGSMAAGSPMMPLVQGRVVGGTSVINGAISWRLPRDVYDEWVAADPALGDALPWDEIDGVTDEIVRDLNIHPTPPEIAGPKNLLFARGAEAMGIEHRPISRNVRGCRGLGRCLQGCPEGNKQSMDQSYLPDACAAGARILSRVRVTRVVTVRGRAAGVTGVADGGGRVTISARRAVVVAASAIGTPALLLASGIDHGPIGHGLQCHPGVSVGGRFPEPIAMWHGATQGHEGIGLRKEGIKLEVLGYDMALVATRVKGVGARLASGIADMAHQAHWGAAIRAEARGRVRSIRGRAVASYSLTKRDLARARRGIRVLGEMFLAAGADYVELGVHGWAGRIDDPRELARFESDGPTRGGAYSAAATHLFGTAAMGSDPIRSVVAPDFQHHAVRRLYIADSSVFPTNTGVNPQTSILALASLCGRRVTM